MTSYSPDIVAFKNRQSGMVLDHYAGKRVEAFNMHTSNRNHQWRRLAQPNGYVAYKNVGTGYLLGHYAGEPMRARDVDVNNTNCQWLELHVYEDTGFVALQNRATGMVLDHYREQSIQAYNGESDRLSQQWQLVSIQPRQQRHQLQAAAVAFGDLEQYDIVAFKNHQTGKIIDHYAGERIEAYTNSVTHHNHKWYRIPMGNNCYAYKNFYTGKVLEHYYGESVQAFTTITHLASHQWQEVAVVGADKRFVALQNCASGKKLHHCHEKSIQACDDEGAEGEGVHSGKTFQWELVWVRRCR